MLAEYMEHITNWPDTVAYIKHNIKSNTNEQPGHIMTADAGKEFLEG